MKRIIILPIAVLIGLILLFTSGSDPAQNTLKADPMANLRLASAELENTTSKKQTKNWKTTLPAEINLWFTTSTLTKLEAAQKEAETAAASNGWQKDARQGDRSHSVYYKDSPEGGTMVLEILSIEEGLESNSNKPTLAIELIHHTIVN